MTHDFSPTREDMFPFGDNDVFPFGRSEGEKESHLASLLDKMDQGLRIAIEPKPNEPRGDI